MKEARGGPILERTMYEAGILGVGLETSSKDAPYTERLNGGRLSDLSSTEVNLERSGVLNPVAEDSGPKVSPHKGRSVAETVLYSMCHPGC